MYSLRYFQMQELVDRKTFQKFEKQSQMLFREEALVALEDLRYELGRPLVVNNWREGGELEWCGLRTLDCYKGAKWSAHRLGCGFDAHCPTMSAPEVQEFIRTKHKQGLLQRIKRMEIGTPTWTHIDTFVTASSALVEFVP